MHLSGKKDKKKQEAEKQETAPVEEGGKEVPSQDEGPSAERLDGDGAEKEDGLDVNVVGADVVVTADVGVTADENVPVTADVGVTADENVAGTADVGVTADENVPVGAAGLDVPDGIVPENERADETITAMLSSASADGGVSVSLEAPDVSTEVDENIKPKLDSIVEAEVPSTQFEGGLDVSAALPSADAMLNSPALDTNCVVNGPEHQEVVVVMNEGTSEEDDVVGDKKEDASEEQADAKIKSSKKGRFKMPSINFHMPKFGGSKKSYKVDAEVNAGSENGIAEGKVDGIEPDIQLGGNVIPEVEGNASIQVEGELQTKVDAEVNAGGGDISIEPEVPDIEIPECRIEAPACSKMEIDAGDLLVVGTALAVSADVDCATPSANIDTDIGNTCVEQPSLTVDANTDVTLNTETTVPEVAANVEIPCESGEIPVKDQGISASVDAPEIEAHVEGPSVSVTVEEPPAPALDQDASVKAKKKGLSLPKMHFRQKFTGKKHPRFRSKAKESKSLSASGKVTTSLPNVATATSLETPLSGEEMRARRASDAADIAAELEISAAGDIDETPGKSKRSRFHFPSLHFSLPRFSSLLSPHKPKNTVEVEEPEMTERKAEVEILDVTAEADIPKTNLDVVMPEVSGMAESAPEVSVEGAVGGVEGAVGGVDILGSEKVATDVDRATSPLALAIEDPFPEVKLDADPVSVEVDLPDISTTDSTVIEGESAVEQPDVPLNIPKADSPNVDGALSTDAAVESPEVNVSDANTSSGEKKNKKKSFLPNMHLPKFHMKGTPIKFRSKGKKETVETPDFEGGVKVGGDVNTDVSFETPHSPDLSMVVNTSGDPNVTVEGDGKIQNSDVEAKDTQKMSGDIEIPQISVAADADIVVKKSEIDVKSPRNEVGALVGNLSDTNVDLPKVESKLDVEGKLSGEGKPSVPDVDVSADYPDTLPVAGTVVIAYDTIVESEVGGVEASIENIDGQGKLDIETDIKTPDVEVHSGATNHVLDLALGGAADQELKVDGNIANLNIPSSDNEESDTKEKQKKKKKRKGLHMPSINLPKFHLRHDKKQSASVGANLPDVVVPNGQVDGAGINIEANTPEVTVPENEPSVKAEVNVECKTEIGNEVEKKLDPLSALGAAAVVACVAMEVGYSEVEVPCCIEEPKASLSVDMKADLPESAEGTVNTSAVMETPSVELDVGPKVDQVVEEVVPSVSQAVAETLPDMATSEDAPSKDVTVDTSNETSGLASPEVEVDDSCLDAEVALNDSSTSTPSKSKKTRMRKINFPKMNFKLSPHKSGVVSHSVPEDVEESTDNSLTPAEIEKIEEALPSGQAHVPVPTVEINGVGTDVADGDVTSSAKKGKYRKRIGGKLKKIRGKSKGKVSVSEDIKGEGLTAGVSLEADREPNTNGSIDLDAGNVDGLENGLCSTQEADVGADITFDSGKFKIYILLDLH